MTEKINTKSFYNSTIPSDWEVKKLKDILIEGRLGGNYENAEANIGIPVIKMGNIQRSFISIEKIQYLPENETYNQEDVLKEAIDSLLKKSMMEHRVQVTKFLMNGYEKLTQQILDAKSNFNPNFSSVSYTPSFVHPPRFASANNSS